METFCLPALKLIATELGENVEEEVVVTAEEALGWLLASVSLPTWVPHGPAEAAGVHFCCCWATEAVESAHVPCHHCIKWWQRDPTVVCWEELLLPGKCTM
jgi:hypothetical protein